MKKIIFYFLLFLMVLEFAVARKTIIKMATLAPEGTPWHALIAKMGERWKEETNGNVRLRIYPGGIVGDERDMIRKMRIGQIHGAAISAEGLSEVNPQYIHTASFRYFFKDMTTLISLEIKLKMILLVGLKIMV